MGKKEPVNIVIIQRETASAEQPIDGSYRYTRVWTNQNGPWQVIARHCTPVQGGSLRG